MQLSSSGSSISSRQLAYLGLHCAYHTGHGNIPISRHDRPTPVQRPALLASNINKLTPSSYQLPSSAMLISPSYHHISPPALLAIRVTITLPIKRINALAHSLPATKTYRSISIPAPAAPPFLIATYLSPQRTPMPLISSSQLREADKLTHVFSLPASLLPLSRQGQRDFLAVAPQTHAVLQTCHLGMWIRKRSSRRVSPA